MITPVRGRDRSLEWVPRATGLFLGVWAIACAVLAVIPRLRDVAEPLVDFADNYILLFSPNLAYASFVGLLAAAVTTRKRAGWWALTVFLTINLGATEGMLRTYTFKGVTATIIAGAGLLLVVLARKHFRTRVRKASFLKALIVLAASLAASVIGGFMIVEALHGSLPGSQRFAWTVNKVFGGLIENSSFDGKTKDWISDLLGFFGAVSLLGAVAIVFQSQRMRSDLRPAEEEAIRALLATSGANDSLGYFATRRDKAVVFAPSGKAAILYRVEIGVCLASGDPIGDPQAWPQAIAAWQALADEYGWTPAVMGASEAGARAYEAAGLNAIQLGDEAIIETGTFTIEGRDMHVVGQAVRRIERLGITMQVRRHRKVPAEDMQLVIECAEKWRGDETERGFSMALGRLADPADGDCLLVEALDPDGQLIALLSFVPWGASGVSLDLMRRDPQAPNGVIEFLVAEIARRGPALSIARISLNFAVFRAAFEEGSRIGAGPVLRAWRRALILLSRWWQLEALYRSNVKFRPHWNPRFLCYDDARMLVRVGFASGIAEGFVNIPERLRSRRGIQPPRLSVDELASIVEYQAEERSRMVAEQPVSEQMRTRLDKLARVTENGDAAYPSAATITHDAVEVATLKIGTAVTISGRIMRMRDHGGVIFADLRDWSGDAQIVLDQASLGIPALTVFGRQFDLGDLADFSGTTGHTQTGTPCVHGTAWRMSAKCLHPLPNKWLGLTDPDSRVRRRYVDLAVNPDSRDLTRLRSNVLRQLRASLHQRGFLEVETPVLQPVHGGANARPFLTHINAYDLDLYLRIAPELYLKRLCVGGMERVFEIGRTFRNEGADGTHNPEFTMLEAYQAHSDYLGMLDTCRELIQAAATAAYGTPIAMRPNDSGGFDAVDLAGEWAVVSVHSAVSKAVGAPIDSATSITKLQQLSDGVGVLWQDTWDAGQIVLELYEQLVEAATVMPTFYIDFPTSVSPLTRSRDDNPDLVERWDLVAFGMELATAYSELTDPLEQRRRLRAQSIKAAQGDIEAMELDEDFLTALEYGMPPTGGLGMGVDRLVMLLTGRSIRETLPFPLTRPIRRGER